jgi:hypothetical protein
MRLTRVDLPAFGRPTMASFSGPFSSSSSGSSSPSSRSISGRSASNRSTSPSPCSAEKGSGSWKPERERLDHPALAGLPLGLVGEQDHRRVLRTAASARSLRRAGRRPRGIDQEQRDVGFAHRRLGLGAHPARQRFRVVVLHARGVDDAEIEAEQGRVALTPVAGDAGRSSTRRRRLPTRRLKRVDLPTLGRPTMATMG